MNTTEEVVFMANALYGRNTVLNSMVIQPKNITVDEETYYRKDFVDFLHKTIGMKIVLFYLLKVS